MCVISRVCLGVRVGSGEEEVKCSAHPWCLHQPQWYCAAPCWIPERTEEHRGHGEHCDSLQRPLFFVLPDIYFRI